MSSSMSMSMRVKLSAMMFIQFMMLPVWFLPMFAYVEKMKGGGQWAFWCGLIMAFGTLSSPLFGMFADRFLNSERVLALCNLAGAILLGYAYTVTDPQILFIVLLLTMLFYMPTWSLTATIAMSNSTTADFPQIRVFGTLGWVASGLFSIIGTKVFGIDKFDSTSTIFLGGAIASLIGVGIALMLPKTPPKAKGTPMSIIDTLGLRALTLFKNFEFAMFTLMILLAMVPFMWYMAYNGKYLDSKGFEFVTLTTNLGQTLELGFMLLIPFILKKAGYKWAMVIGLAALVVRYGAFYIGASTGSTIADFAGILVHGLIFGLLIVGAQMYVDAKAPAELRGQAQGLMGLIMFGFGAVLSNNVFDHLIRVNTVNGKCDWSKPYLVALIISVVLMVVMALFFNPKREESK